MSLSLVQKFKARTLKKNIKILNLNINGLPVELLSDSPVFTSKMETNELIPFIAFNGQPQQTSKLIQGIGTLSKQFRPIRTIVIGDHGTHSQKHIEATPSLHITYQELRSGVAWEKINHSIMDWVAQPKTTPSDFKLEDDPPPSDFLDAYTHEKWGPFIQGVQGPMALWMSTEGNRTVHAKSQVGFVQWDLESKCSRSSIEEIPGIICAADPLNGLALKIFSCEAIENGLGITIPERARYLRTIALELNRILTHLYVCANSMTAIESHQIANIYLDKARHCLKEIEAFGGDVFQSHLPVIGGCQTDITLKIVHRMKSFLDQCETSILELLDRLLLDYFWNSRTRGLASLSAHDAHHTYMITGPNLRASGIHWDLRKRSPNTLYQQLNFNIPLGTDGDTFDRIHVRHEETLQSISIIRQCINNIPYGSIGIQHGEIPKSFPENFHSYHENETARGLWSFELSNRGVRFQGPSQTTCMALEQILADVEKDDIILALSSLAINTAEVDYS